MRWIRALPSVPVLLAIIARVAGLLVILPSIAVLALLVIYTGRSWRAYLYVPVGAAIALVSLVALLTAPVKAPRPRQLQIIGVCMLLMMPGIARLSAQQRQFRQSADAKARVLRQIADQGSSIDAGAHLISFTTMTTDELVARGIWHLEWSMLDSAMYMLNKARGPKVAFLCRSSGSCSRDNTCQVVGSRDFLSADEDYRDVVMFQLHDDLRAELLRELPPRARSLLGAAWRDRARLPAIRYDGTILAGKPRLAHDAIPPLSEASCLAG